MDLGRCIRAQSSIVSWKTRDWKKVEAFYENEPSVVSLKGATKTVAVFCFLCFFLVTKNWILQNWNFILLFSILFCLLLLFKEKCFFVYKKISILRFVYKTITVLLFVCFLYKILSFIMFLSVFFSFSISIKN